MIQKVLAVRKIVKFQTLSLDGILIEHKIIFESDFDIVLEGCVNFHPQAVHFRHCAINQFPSSKIWLKYENSLTHLSLYNCQLPKIDKNNLFGLGGLKFLNLSANKIERLPEGLFLFTPKLEDISFYSNRIKWIHPNILEPLKNLKKFDLRFNDAFNLAFNKFFDVPTLAQLKQEINEKCKIPEETVNQKIDDLKKEIDGHKREIGGHKRKIDELKQARETQRRKIDGHQREIDELKQTRESQTKKIAQLEEIIKKRDFPDFTVKINGRDIRVKKAILAANSPLLAKMMNENKDANEIDLKDVSEDTFEMILAFMYNKTPPNNNARLIEAYGASGRLEMKELMDITAVMLLEQINPNNALEVLNLSKKYGNKELEKKAFDELKKAYA